MRSLESKPGLSQDATESEGRFGKFGGRYVPDTLMAPVLELEKAYAVAKKDPQFASALHSILKNFVGRETPLDFAENLSREVGGHVRIYLKREDLAHTGAHKINNVVGQILLAKRTGKTRIVAETGAGQHGVATAAVAARFGLQCVVYMGQDDIERQGPNVRRMKLLGAEVVAVKSGSRTLKDAVSEAMRDWVANLKNTFYLLGSALGPHPYPTMVRDFQSVIGREARAQILDREGRLPDRLIACVGGGSNALGLFHPFLEDEDVAMTGVEAGGRSFAIGEHAARFQTGAVGVFQGTETFVLQDSFGQILKTHSVSAGLDYAAVGPEHSYLREIGRVQYESVRDDEALDAFQFLSKSEGILPALESSHAVAAAMKLARSAQRGSIFIVNLSGRGDKDLDIVEAALRSQL